LHQHPIEERVIAVGLAALAGFVDAHAFLELGGYFVSFMSGNTTRIGAGVVENLAAVLVPAGLIALFVAGVVSGTIAARLARLGSDGIMYVVTGLLAVAALLATLGYRTAAVAVLAVAMGAENGVFVRNGEVSIGLTYVTGALVKLGQRLAAALLGGDRWGWVWYLLLWMGLTAGAVLGALSYMAIDLAGLWVAVAAGLGLGLALTRLRPA
jgi:uncharacterized membrane protein YoaK (UPF0700 family)